MREKQSNGNIYEFSFEITGKMNWKTAKFIEFSKISDEKANIVWKELLPYV